VDTEKQRQRRHDNARLTESGNARSEQLLVMPTESLTNREWLPGELQNVEGPVGFGYELFQKAMEDSYWASIWVQWIAPHLCLNALDSFVAPDLVLLSVSLNSM